jgi:hypothetical protein
MFSNGADILPESLIALGHRQSVWDYMSKIWRRLCKPKHPIERALAEEAIHTMLQN